MLPLFARAGAAMIPGASRLPFVGGERAGEVPDLVLTLDDVAVDRERLAAYDRVCKLPLRDGLPATYPHMLAFPLHLSLMTDPSFPFPALGLVHIANRIVQHRPIGAEERLELRVWATALEPHPRGTQFTLRSEARVGDELVWEESSTILKRGSSEGTGEASAGGEREPPTSETGEPSADDAGEASLNAEREPSAGEEGEAPPGEEPPGEARQGERLPVTATWRLPGDLGRRYASVSGDLNPIHIHPLTAKLFGFRTAIAHGMWTKARCLAALDPRLPDRFTVKVAFKKPILLPATVEFLELDNPAGIRFAVRGAGKGTPHLDGAVEV
jgi:acyl dehydratase